MVRRACGTVVHLWHERGVLAFLHRDITARRVGCTVSPRKNGRLILAWGTQGLCHWSGWLRNEGWASFLCLPGLAEDLSRSKLILGWLGWGLRLRGLVLMGGCVSSWIAV